MNTTGQSLRDNLVPLPVNQPSAVLFNLLGLLISFSEKVGSVNDAMTGGNPGQNTPAYTQRSMEQQGMQVDPSLFLSPKEWQARTGIPLEWASCIPATFVI